MDETLSALKTTIAACTDPAVLRAALLAALDVPAPAPNYGDDPADWTLLNDGYGTAQSAAREAAQQALKTAIPPEATRRVLENSHTTIRGIQRRLESVQAGLAEVSEPVTEPVQAALDDAAVVLRNAAIRLGQVVEAIGQAS